MNFGQFRKEKPEHQHIINHQLTGFEHTLINGHLMIHLCIWVSVCVCVSMCNVACSLGTVRHVHIWLKGSSMMLVRLPQTTDSCLFNQSPCQCI